MTVVSVYTKVCVVVARYSNAVPYFYGVLSVCRPFPPTVVTNHPWSAQKVTRDSLPSTQAKMTKGKRSKDNQGKVQSSGSGESAHQRPQHKKKKDFTGKCQCHQPQRSNFKLQKWNELKKRLRLKNGSRTRLNQQSMARSQNSRRSKIERRLEDGEKCAEGNKVGKISSSLKQENRK